MLSHVTFSEWLFYYFTLRIEHFIDKIIQYITYIYMKYTNKLNYDITEEEAQIALLKHFWTQSTLGIYFYTIIRIYK